MKYTPEILTALHSELKEILVEIIRVCQECGIEYFIQGGTAIGAFFYNDLIPWDDDIDIGMTRSEYERFLAVAPSHLGPQFVLQEFTAEPSTPFYFAKIRKRNTLFVEYPYQDSPIEQGIYVDLFPYDRIPDNAVLERLHRLSVRFWINCYEGKTLWLWRWFAPHGATISRPLPKSRLSCAMIRLVCQTKTKKQIYRRMNRVMQRYNNRPYSRVNIVRMPLDQIERKAVENPVTMLLDGIEVNAPANVESYLRHHYKDLQRDIPPERQVNHAPVILSFDSQNGPIYRE